MAACSRRWFLQQTGTAALAVAMNHSFSIFSKNESMKTNTHYDVIIVGGSYSGLAAAMALGRARKTVLIVDSGKPCNAQTPHSHNFLTQDGNTPAGIAEIAKRQVSAYQNISFEDGLAVNASKNGNGFELTVQNGNRFTAEKLIFATGIKDLMPQIAGFSECWGISVIHCPYCHGYEARDTRTGIFANGDHAFEFAMLISNWAKDLAIYTNGISKLTSDQVMRLIKHGITVIEKEITKLTHTDGQISDIVFADGTKSYLNTLYAPRPFEQHCKIPERLGCELTEDGYIKVNAFQETTVPGVYACGDNAAKMRTVANAVSMGTTAGMSASKKLILEKF
jgi:thioredoxin reductase